MTMCNNNNTAYNAGGLFTNTETIYTVHQPVHYGIFYGDLCVWRCLSLYEIKMYRR